MPAEPPRDTIHVTQHLLYDGLRIMRAQMPAEVLDDKLLAELDKALALLQPMTGMPIRDAAPRMYALSHALRILVEELIPYNATKVIDVSAIPPMLAEFQKRLEPLRATAHRWSESEMPTGPGRTDLNLR
ncbi:MAG: hypothetical protein AB7M12_11655 [Hyphomonadaceae bacterium]